MGSGVSTEVISLVDTIRSNKGDERLIALTRLFELSDVVENKAPMSSHELGLLKELANIIKEDKAEARLLAVECVWYLSRDDEAKLNIADSQLEVIEVIINTSKECFN